MSEMFHSLIPIISQITYKNDFNRNSFFLPSAGEALADIYDEEIVPFYDSEMVYQCDKIWPKKFEDYTDVSFFIYTYTQDNLMITSWVSRGGGGKGERLLPPGRSKLYCNAFSLWTLELDVLRETSQYRTCLPPGLLSADAHGLLIP